MASSNNFATTIGFIKQLCYFASTPCTHTQTRTHTHVLGEPDTECTVSNGTTNEEETVVQLLHLSSNYAKHIYTKTCTYSHCEWAPLRSPKAKTCKIAAAYKKLQVQNQEEWNNLPQETQHPPMTTSK